MIIYVYRADTWVKSTLQYFELAITSRVNIERERGFRPLGLGGVMRGEWQAGIGQDHKDVQFHDRFLVGTVLVCC